MLLGATACGGGGDNESKKSADQILQDAKAALTSASSVHLVGDVDASGSKVHLDLVVKGGGGMKGTFSQSGSSADILEVGNTLYLKMGAAMLTAQKADPATVQLLKNKWLKASAGSSAVGGIGDFGDLSKLADRILVPGGKVTKGAQKKVAGTDAIGLTSDADKNSTLYVSTQDARPLQIQNTGSDGGTLSFTGYGSSVTIAAPPADQVVDMSKLGAG